MTARLQVVGTEAAAPQRGARSSIAKVAAARDKPDKPYEVRADKPLGLLLRVQPSGRRTFYAQTGRGKRVRIGRADVFTLQQAEKRAREILLDPEAATSKRTRGGITLLEYLDEHYASHAKATTKTGAATVARVKSRWEELLDKRMTDISEADVKKRADRRKNEGTAPSTLNRDVMALRSVLRHWAENTKSATNPIAELKAYKVADDETVRYLSPAESKRLRKALSDRDQRMAKERESANAWRSQRRYELLPALSGYADYLTPMALLSLNTGMRQGETFALTWGQVDLKLKTVTVLASHAKGNSTRTIPLNAEALKVLQAVKPKDAGTHDLVFPSPVTGDRLTNVKRAWGEAAKAAKLPDLRWHDLRHDFASQLVMKGVPLYHVQKLLGHASPKMTQRYAKLAPGALADAVKKLGK